MKKLSLAAMTAATMTLIPNSMAAPTASFEVSVDVAELCSLQARSAHLGIAIKDSGAAAGALQSASARNLKITCGAGFEVDLSNITIGDASQLTSTISQATGAAALVQQIADMLTNPFPLQFQSDNDFVFIDADTNALPYKLFYPNSADPVADLAAAAQDAPNGFASGACAGTFSEVTSESDFYDVSGGLPISLTTGDIVVTAPIVGDTTVASGVPNKLEAGSTLIDLCYQVTTADVNSAAVTDGPKSAQYEGDYAADGAAATGDYKDKITVTLQL